MKCKNCNQDINVLTDLCQYEDIGEIYICPFCDDHVHISDSAEQNELLQARLDKIKETIKGNELPEFKVQKIADIIDSIDK